MKASVSGASRRLGNSTWSGRPVECSAEQITGTPASQPASRPQNILSPPVPTVTTASIRRRRISRVSRHSTRNVVLVRQQAGEGRDLPGQHLAQRAEVLQAAQFRQEPLAVHAADQFHQQRLRAAHRHARDHEHHPQRTAVGKRHQFSAAIGTRWLAEVELRAESRSGAFV